MSLQTYKNNERAKALAHFLKAKRLEAGHTMRTLSELMKTPHSFIGKVEKLERRLDLPELFEYCKWLGVNPQDAFDAVKNSAGVK